MGVCGRYVARRGVAALTSEFEAADRTGDDPVSEDFNVAPTKPVPVVLSRRLGGQAEGPVVRQLRTARWGLVPSWSAGPGSGGRLLINARAETAARTPSFRVALARRRCLVPADGWYEWARVEPGARRQPYFLCPGDGEVLAFAGLYELWGDSRLLSTAVLTTAATGELTAVHDRMPLLVPRRSWDAWLDPTRPDPSGLLVPDPELVARIGLRPVGPAVGNVANNGPELIAPASVLPPVQVPAGLGSPVPQVLF